jgi:hypothetical protein
MHRVELLSGAFAGIGMLLVSRCTLTQKHFYQWVLHITLPQADIVTFIRDTVTFYACV